MTKISRYFIVLLAVLVFALSVTATVAVIFAAKSEAFLNGTLMTTPLWEYLVVNWIGTGVLELAIGVYIVLYMAPKGVDKMVAQGIKEAKQSPELSPFLDKFKEIMVIMEPMVKQVANALKNVDLEKTQKDFQPLMNALKEVDPKELNGLMKDARELMGAIKTVIVKPNIPPPPETEETKES